MPSVGFEPTIPASEWHQNNALDRAATGIGVCICIYIYIYVYFFPNGRYIDCSSLTYATSIRKPFNIYIKVLTTRSSHRGSRRDMEGVQSKSTSKCCTLGNVHTAK